MSSIWKQVWRSALCGPARYPSSSALTLTRIGRGQICTECWRDLTWPVSRKYAGLAWPTIATTTTTTFIIGLLLSSSLLKCCMLERASPPPSFLLFSLFIFCLSLLLSSFSSSFSFLFSFLSQTDHTLFSSSFSFFFLLYCVLYMCVLFLF